MFNNFSIQIILGMMQFVMTYELTELNNFTIWSHHRANKRHEMRTHLLRSEGTPERTEVITELDILKNQMDLEGQHFRIAAIPFVPLLAINSQNTSQAEGFHKALFDALASQLNFTYDIIIPGDYKFGGLQANGNWSGIVGMCHRGEVDFGMPIRRTPLREKYIRYSPNILPYTLTIVSFLQDSRTTSILSLLHPRSLAALIITLLAFFVMLLLVFKLLNYHEDEVNIGAIAITCFGQFTNQGSEMASVTHLSYKVLIFSMSAFGLLFACIYSAQLTSYVSVQRPAKQVETYQDVIDMNIKLFVTDGTAGLDDFKSLGASVAQAQIWRDHLSQDSYYTGPKISKNWERMLKSSDRALQLSHFALSKYAAKNWAVGCQLHQAVQPKKYYFTIPYGQRFPYKKLFDLKIMKLQESGVIDRLESSLVYQK